MNKVLVISGLTATGKSNLALSWAKEFNGEIISVDSVAVYRQLSIASAKPPLKAQQEVKHYGIDIVDVNQTFSVMEYQTLARSYIQQVIDKGKLPILVGGSGLYLKAVLTDYQFNKEEQPDSSWTQAYTNEQLHQMLTTLDPDQANKIHVNNRKRLQRALVLIKEAKMSKTELLQKQTQTNLYDVMMICTDLPKEKLHRAIDLRVDQMIAQGLHQEVVNAHKLADFKKPAMMAIGVKEWQPVFEQTQSVSEAIEKIKTHTKQFSKRQRTWFKHQHQCHWVMMDDHQAIAATKLKVQQWLNQ